MLTVLRRRDFALLWVAGLVSLTGDWMLYVALPIYVYQLTDSVLAGSGVLIAGQVPALALGSVAGVFVDRWDRRRTMVVANLLRPPLLLLLLPVREAADVWLVYAVAFAASAIGQFFGPAENALLPRLVDAAHLVPANALNALNNNLARLIGPPLGGFVAGAFGLRGVAVADAASFLVAGVLVALIAASGRPEADPASPADAAAGAWRAVWRELVAGLRLVRGSRTVATVFAFLAVASLGEGVFGILIVVFTAEVLGGGAPEVGWLMGAQAVGGLAGSVLLGWWGKGASPVRLLGWGSIGLGVVDLAIFNYPALVPGIGLGLVLFVVVGVPAVMVGTGQATLLQTGVVDAYRGRVFGALGTTSSLLRIVGSLLAGTLAERLGVVAVLTVQGVAYVAGGAMVLLALGGAGARVRDQDRAAANPSAPPGDRDRIPPPPLDSSPT